jgi:hypothetical protein
MVLLNDSLDLSVGEVNGPCVHLRSRRCYTKALLAVGMSAQTITGLTNESCPATPLKVSYSPGFLP